MSQATTILERLPDGSILTSPGCTSTEVNLHNNQTIVSSTPALLFAVYVNTTLNGYEVGIKDNDDKKLVLPPSLPAGTMIDFHGAKFVTNLTVKPDNSSTGEIVVFWKEI